MVAAVDGANTEPNVRMVPQTLRSICFHRPGNGRETQRNIRISHLKEMASMRRRWWSTLNGYAKPSVQIHMNMSDFHQLALFLTTRMELCVLIRNGEGMERMFSRCIQLCFSLCCWKGMSITPFAGLSFGLTYHSFCFATNFHSQIFRSLRAICTVFDVQ